MSNTNTELTKTKFTPADKDFLFTLLLSIITKYSYQDDDIYKSLLAIVEKEKRQDYKILLIKLIETSRELSYLKDLSLSMELNSQGSMLSPVRAMLNLMKNSLESKELQLDNLIKQVQFYLKTEIDVEI